MSFIRVIDTDDQALFLRAGSVNAILSCGKEGCFVRVQGLQQGMFLKNTAPEVLAMLQAVDDQHNFGQPMFGVGVLQKDGDLSEWAVRSILARQRAPQG